MGKPMALSENPTMAIQVEWPACAPKNGGKIKFPAPKNMENSVKPTSNMSLRFNFFKRTPPFLLTAYQCITAPCTMSIHRFRALHI